MPSETERQGRPLRVHEYTVVSPWFLKAYTCIEKLSSRAFKRYMTLLYRRVIYRWKAPEQYFSMPMPEIVSPSFLAMGALVKGARPKVKKEQGQDWFTPGNLDLPPSRRSVSQSTSFNVDTDPVWMLDTQITLKTYNGEILLLYYFMFMNKHESTQQQNLPNDT